MEGNPVSAPRGVPERILLVVLPTGEKHFLEKPMLDGIEEWAKGMDVTIAEYRFAEVVHTPPPTKPKS
jgi:hypothetical protein